MKIALAQLNFQIGNFEFNGKRIEEAIDQAKQQYADLIIFPELAVCGYPPRDFLEFDDFIEKSQDVINKIIPLADTIVVVIGAPTKNPAKAGKNLYNSAFFIANNKIHYIQHKTLLPNYDIFDEYRYFEPNTVFNLIEYKGKKIALTICEDLWNVDNDPMYINEPMAELIKMQPDLIINIAASPFDYHHSEKRLQILQTNAKKYNLPLVYVNHVGAQTELIFDGGSLSLNQTGDITHQSPFFEENIAYINPFTAPRIENQPVISPIERIYLSLVIGVRDYFFKLGFNKAILGLSGGIDSALTMVIASEALGAENVMGLLMPSQFSTDHSVSDALLLAEKLGCPHETMYIENIYNSFSHDLNPYFHQLPFNITEENLQARIRAVLLMAWSNKFGYILLNTSNKSEAAVGYGTLYGDMCGGLSVLGDVYKTQVYELSKFVNRNEEIIPENIITKAPSAELRPNQKDTDSLPTYDILDDLLFHYIENRQGPKELVKMGFDKDLVERVLKMVNTNEYKRHQAPPILRISPKAFGMGRRMPIVGTYLS